MNKPFFPLKKQTYRLRVFLGKQIPFSVHQVCKNAFMWMLIFTMSCGFSYHILAQPSADMPLYKYKSNKTPYALYAGSFGMNLSFSEDELHTLAENFEALYGAWDMTFEQAEKLRSIHPNFSILAYKGNWILSRLDRDFVDAGHPNEILYYRAGNLKNTITTTDSVFEMYDLFGGLLPSTAHRDSNLTYWVADTQYYNTFLRIGNEFVKILRVENEKVYVKRAFFNSTASAHQANAIVLAPVYGKAPAVDSKHGYTYRHDERSTLRWNALLKGLSAEYEELGAGIWIDILIGNLSHYTINGETCLSERIWDIEKDTIYVPIARAKNTEKGIKYMQDEFFKTYGKYPVIWGNNMMFPVNLQHDRLQMLLQTPEKPRPVDGFAMENCFAQYGYGGHSGKEFMYESYQDWINVVQAIMYTGEIKVSARPLMMDGGIDNKKFAALPKARRHELFMYGYASYLMAVKVENDGTIYSQFGFCPYVYHENENTTLELDDCFMWDIGKPVDNFASTDVLKYQLPETRLFAREFENAIVLVNPSDSAQNNVSLSKWEQKLRDAETQKSVSESITIAAHTGRILFFNSAKK